MARRSGSKQKSLDFGKACKKPIVWEPSLQPISKMIGSTFRSKSTNILGDNSKSFFGKRFLGNLITCFTNITAFQKLKMIIQKLTQILFKKARPEKEQFKTLIPGRRDLLEIYQQLRIDYPHTQALKTFVETGTFHGETVRKMEPYHDRN